MKKMKKMNRIINILEYITIFLSVLYLTVDVFHYFLFRLNYDSMNSGIIWEAFYEADCISYLRWGILMSFLLFLKLFRNNTIYYSIIQLAISCLIIILSYNVGRFYYLFRGSIVFDFFVMEIIALVAFVIGYYKWNMLKIKEKIFSFIIVLVLSMVFFFATYDISSLSNM